MSDSREIILAKREGYVCAARRYATHLHGQAWAVEAAANTYPLPKKTVPNVQKDETGVSWKFDDNCLWLRNGDWSEWTRQIKPFMDSRNRVAIAAVLATPTIEVEDDETV